MNAFTIIELMHRYGWEELTAKRAFYCICARTARAPTAHELHLKLLMPGAEQGLHHYFNEIDPGASERVDRWPAIAHVFQLVQQYGVDCHVAVELLTSCGPIPEATTRVFNFFHQSFHRGGAEPPPWIRAQLQAEAARQTTEANTTPPPSEEMEKIANAAEDAEELAIALQEDEERKVVGGYGEENELEADAAGSNSKASSEDGDEEKDKEMSEAEEKEQAELGLYYAEMTLQEKWQEKAEQKYWQDRLRLFVPYICSAPPMDEVEAEAAMARRHTYIPLYDCWRLYTYWLALISRIVGGRLTALERAYGVLTRRIHELGQLADVHILRRAKVIGMTTTGAAMHQAALRALRPRVVVVEEAAEVLEAHILTSITRACEHLILIGDHQQLRPNPAVYELARRYNLEISLFERLINNGYPHRALRLQHRMRPEISRTLMPHFYPNLEDAPNVASYPPVAGMRSNFHFFTHHWPECAIDPTLGGRSHSNEQEVVFTLRLAKYLRQQQQYEPGEITILCTYLEQLLKLRKMAESELGKEHGIRIENVDNYQGEESKIIVLSLVRSTLPTAGASIMEEEPQRRSQIGYQ